MRSISKMTVAATLLTLAACGGKKADTSVAPAQQFTRQVAAPTTRVVAATVTLFSEYGIPISSANEGSGVVTSMPTDIRGNWNNATGVVADRAECGAAVTDPEASRMIFGIQIRPTSSGSDVTLTARNAKAGWRPSTTAAGCYLRSTFMTQMLDEIARRASSNP
ncbi:MAG: hypothetical protein ABI637_07025 [Gemmatimonadota bacterium]